MTRFDARSSLKACVLLVVTALLFNGSMGRAAAPPAAVAITINPTPVDCYSGPGCLDTTFGVSGKVRQDVGGTQVFAPRYQTAYSMAVQPDGKLVAVGSTRYPTTGTTWVIARFESTGALDASFGTAGVVTLANFSTVSDVEEAKAVALQSDGKILAAGGVYGTTTPAKGVVVRLTTSGQLDTTFGSAGKVLLDLGGHTFSAMKLQPDGKILLAGSDGSPLASSIVRLKTNGALDTTFGSGGTRSVSFGLGARFIIRALALQSNGKIVAGGAVSSPFSGFALIRVTTSGSLDTSFGVLGKTVANFGGVTDYDIANSVVVAADDSIVAGGRTRVTGAVTNDMAIARFSANGSIVNSFGTSGKVILNMNGGEDQVKGLAIQADGKIVFAGYAMTPDFPAAGYRSFMIVGRLQSTGALDSSFGSGGITETAFAERDQAHTMVLDASGRITVAGYSNDPSSDSTGKMTWALARYYQ